MRFHDFNDEELDVLLRSVSVMRHWTSGDQRSIASDLKDEIKHLQEERKMARRRQELPA